MGLQVEVGNRGSEDQASPVGRDAESLKPQFAERIHDDDPASPAAEPYQFADQPRVVACRIRSRDQRQVRLAEVLQHDRACPRSIDFGERHARGLVAVEGAVVDVSGAVGTGHQLHQERGLVARTPGGIEEDLLGTGVAEGVPGDRERLFPADAPETAIARPGQHRERDPAQAFEFRGGEGFHATERQRLQQRLADARLHVASLCLDGLLAHLGETSRLVHHAPVRPSHPQRAGLAGIPAAHPSVEGERAAGGKRLPNHIGDGRQAAGSGDPESSHDPCGRAHPPDGSG